MREHFPELGFQIILELGFVEQAAVFERIGEYRFAAINARPGIRLFQGVLPASIRVYLFGHLRVPPVHLLFYGIRVFRVKCFPDGFLVSGVSRVNFFVAPGAVFPPGQRFLRITPRAQP
jgi:hypothetical protein